MTLHPRRSGPLSTTLLAALVLAVLPVGLLAGCTGDPGAGPEGGRSATAPARVSPPVTSASRTPTAGPDRFSGVRWATLAYPESCAPVGAVVDQLEVRDLTGDQVPEAVVAVHCDAGAGNPPSNVYVFDPPARFGGIPRLRATLLGSRPWVQVDRVDLGRGSVRVRGMTYSGDDVPRCCPDRRYDRSWRWSGSRFVPLAATPPR